MKNQLKPRSLDVVITKITNKTVTYELAANRKTEQWRVPASSTFDKTKLVVGERYHVLTRVIPDLQWDVTAKKRIYKDSYEWVYATRDSPLARCTAKAKRENSIDLPLADEGKLFVW